MVVDIGSLRRRMQLQVGCQICQSGKAETYELPAGVNGGPGWAATVFRLT